jgi:integrase
MLFDISKYNLEGNFIFSLTDGLYPVSYYQVQQNFKKALTNFGVSNDRNITIHCWRHFYNSLLKKRNVPLNQVMALIGHRTTEMSDLYTQQPKIEEMVGVLQIQEELFGNS